MALSILDCTIRDGGHLNKWDFPPSMVRAAFYAAQRSGADYFEIGYRYPAQTPNVGLFATCPDEFLFELVGKPSRCRLTVMIDAGKCETSYFPLCQEDLTPVKVVRVAAYPYELDKAMGQIMELHEKGYEVFFNLMASSELMGEEFTKLQNWSDKHIVSALCFADSFGSFLPGDIKTIVSRLKLLGFNRIGFHSHNNLQMAFANTICAIEEGVEVVDASIFGMGRGAGNLPIELLIGHFERLGRAGYNSVPYIDVIDRYFVELRRKIEWGYTLPGLMSGLANVHPYYVNTLFKDGLYTADETWNALRAIKQQCPIAFSPEKMREELGQRFYTPLSAAEAVRICAGISDQIHSFPDQDAVPVTVPGFQHMHPGRKVLLIANGPSVLKYRNEINTFIQRHDCVTIGMNNLNKLYEPDYHIFISRKRFEQYGAEIAKRSQLLLPSFFGRDFVATVTDRQPMFFNCAAPCDEEIPPVDADGQHCMALNVAISSMLTAYQMGATEIYAVGIDGYVDENDKNMIYFYNENNVLDDKQTASTRYDLFARELDRVNRFLQSRSVSFNIISSTSHRKYYQPIDSL